MSPITLFVYVMVISGKMHKPEDVQTLRLFSLATFVPHSSPALVCIATLRLVASGSQVADWEPQEAANTN